MGNSCSRLQHQAGDATDRDKRATPIFIDCNESAVLHVELGVLDEDQRSTFFLVEWVSGEDAPKRGIASSPADQHQPAAKGPRPDELDDKG